LLQLRPLGLESLGNIFEENQPEDDVLIFGRFKVAPEAVRCFEEFCFKA
jgi:hypothetical protein